MKYKIILSTLIFVFLIFSSLACANRQFLAQSFHIAEGQFSYSLGQHAFGLPLKPGINKWNVNCDRTRAIVWGRDWSEFKIGDSPFSIIYLIDINLRKIIADFTVARGPYKVLFSQDKNFAMIDEDLIDLSSGSYADTVLYADITPESCPDFPGKQSD